MIRRTGWLPDPPKKPGEKPDFDAAMKLRAAPLPVLASNRRLVVEVLDQGGLGSCVENAAAQIVRMSHVRQGAVNPPLGSRLFGYYHDRAAMHSVDDDSGTYIRLAFENRNRFGFCPESAWPYVDDGQTFKRQPTPSAYRAAFDQRAPTEYYRIYETGADRVRAVKRAIADGYGVAWGGPVSFDFCANKLGSKPLDPPTESEVAGLHAMVLVGYVGDEFDDLNSWGTGWGNSGYCRLSADYVADSRAADFWLVRAAPLFSETP